MLKFKDVNKATEQFIKDNYTEQELKDELNLAISRMSELDKFNVEYNGDYEEHLPYFLSNYDKTRVWLVCDTPNQHKDSFLEKTDVVKFEKTHTNKSLKAIAKELGIDYNRLKKDYDEKNNELDDFLDLDNALWDTLTTLEIEFEDENKNNIVVYG